VSASADPREPITSRRSIRLLVFSASLRAASLNSRLARRAGQVIEEHGCTAELAAMADFDCPSYNQDVQDRDGFPPGADALRRRLEANTAFVIASPEYNGSVPGVLKNAIDWVSRYRPQPFNERHGLLVSASPSLVGGNRGLWTLRVPLEHLGARVFPDMFSLAQARTAFGPEDRLAEPQLAERFARTITAFLDLVEAATRYPCAKQAWIEFLGEKQDPALERAE